MGDARLWQHIAIYNGLKPPFTDDQAAAPLSGDSGADESPFEGAIGIGSKVLIPTNQKSSVDLPILPVYGVEISEPAEHLFLGSDLALEAVRDVYGTSRALYDIPINTELGSVDAKLVQGMDNLGQMALIRLITEKGHDVLYKQLGLRRVVGMGFKELDLEMAKFRLIETLDADPRISKVQSLQVLQTGAGDTLEVDARLEVRGMAETQAVRVTL
jgi:hypothetical protein